MTVHATRSDDGSNSQMVCSMDFAFTHACMDVYVHGHARIFVCMCASVQGSWGGEGAGEHQHMNETSA